MDKRDEGLSPRILFFFEHSIQGGQPAGCQATACHFAVPVPCRKAEHPAHRVRKDATQPVTQIAWTQVKSGLSAHWSCSKAPNAQTPSEPRTSAVPCSAPCPIFGASIRYGHSNPCTSWHFHVSSARVATSLEASGTLNIVRAAWSPRKNTLAWRPGNDLSQRDLSRRPACGSPLQADIRRAILSLRFSG